MSRVRVGVLRVAHGQEERSSSRKQEEDEEEDLRVESGKSDWEKQFSKAPV